MERTSDFAGRTSAAAYHQCITANLGLVFGPQFASVAVQLPYLLKQQDSHPKKAKEGLVAHRLSSVAKISFA
jgi:hypothetical protein